MDIKYLGHSSFHIRTKDARIVTDPFDSAAVGLKYPKQEADIVSISHMHADHNSLDGVKGTPFVLDWPGEYEKNRVRINAYSTFHDKTNGSERGENIMFKFDSENITVLHCGDLGHLLSDANIEEIGEVDILLIPTGGFYSLSPEDAVKVIRDIEPSIVIPMHYLVPEMIDVYKDLLPVAAFQKAMGVPDIQAVEKLTIKKDDLVPGETKVVVMQATS